MRREESRHDFAFFAGVVIGAVAGAVATLALAPRGGAQMPEKLRERVQQVDVERIRERARTASESVRETAASRAKELREKAAAGEGGSFVETARERAAEMVNRSPLPVDIDDASSKAEDLQESIEDTVEEAEEAARQRIERAAESADEAMDTAEEKAEDAKDDLESRTRTNQPGE